MNRALVKGFLLVTLLVVGTFSLSFFPVVQAAEKPVTAKSIAYEGTTIIEYQNGEDSGSDIESIRMWLSKGVNFKSFKTEKGWVGKKSLTGVITFTATDSVKPGESVKFGIKTDKINPAINWKAFDEKDNQIATAKTLVSTQESTSGETTSKLDENSGIFDDSVFRLIPSEPKVGSSIRVLGENFGIEKDLEFYIGNKKIKSFTSGNDGSFIVTIKVPVNQPAERTDFIVKDLFDNQKLMSLRIKVSESRMFAPQEVGLAIHTYGDVFYRGQEIEITGTASPLSTITISITNPDGERITNITTEADIEGNFVIKYLVPLDAMFGKYVSEVSDGKSSITHRFKIETSKKIIVTPSKQIFQPGETVAINGTAIPDEELELVLEDSTGNEVFSTIIDVRASGKVDYEFPLEQTALKGTWVLFVSQGDEKEIVLIGVGQLPGAQLIIRADKLNYKTNEDVLFEISGPPSAVLSLIIIDPSDKEKFSDVITLEADGHFDYTLDLDGYASGVYTAVVTRGNAQANEKFSIGLQTGSGPIEIRTTKETYLLGEGILILGKSGQNVILTISLFDPDGNLVKEKDIFTDKDGGFSTSSFRVPFDAKEGFWTIKARSGPNLTTLDIKVIATEEEGLVVRTDKTPSNYNRGDLLTINGFGAAPSRGIFIEILAPDGTDVQSLIIFSTGAGTFTTVWNIPNDIDAGTYTLKADDGTETAETTFTIQ